ncbi:hypothetical protein CLAFUW4_14278 [Fulvia fulva]|uniref:Uncharacterized protein n=1 Tax=Passalora fulva TaxID=5499 RepID=A0A9Q8UWH3_PASFU|nr:uncharacterized protein CLAFUR5_14111 [Fulvia fulva]KAK4609028.1 hypothetical protein CLAFUR4_14278 [Fulvia fulva]KAK4609734.1 hypothetical protein CLAFUR0_14282 [Fulvia fulva]UJO25016.1 hypothetical protein CLAFUR5_14111 [Fulvia fulva]WPV22657.1 hypothetical protein CLAFUW4_14278 [Fulvia fulva]WPV37430.1 hypothetical protein CLAFUW7_14286 [Fulvia fulva]
MTMRNKHLQKQLLMGDLFLACVNLEPCLCGHDYDPGPSDLLELQVAELCDASASSLLLGSSLLAADNAIVLPELKDLVQQIIEVYTVKSQMRIQNMSTKRALQTGHWITTRNMAIRNRLLAVNSIADGTNAIRTALIMWTLLTMNITGRLKTIGIMAQRLQQLYQRLPYEATQLSQCWFWLLTIGHMCSSAGSGTCSWFLHRLYDLEEIRITLSTQDCHKQTLTRRLKTMQCGFLYDDAIQGPLTEALAASLVITLSAEEDDSQESDWLSRAHTDFDTSFTSLDAVSPE